MILHGSPQRHRGHREVGCVEQRRVPLIYKGLRLADVYRIDLLVEESVVVEIKAVEALQPIHQAQLLTYLKLLRLPLGLLINFNVQALVKGVRRVANGS